MRAVATVLRGAPWRSLVLACVLGAAADLSSVALVATATWLIVRAAAQPPIAALSLAIVGVRGFALARGALRYTERLGGHDAALAMLAVLRARVYAAVARLGPSRPELRGDDALGRLVADVEAVGDLLLRAVLPVVVAMAGVVGAVVLAALLVPAAGAVLAGGAVLAVLAVPAAVGLRVRRVVAARDAARDALARRCLDLVDGAAELAAYGAGVRAHRAATAAADGLAVRQRTIGRVEAAAGATVVALQAATTVAVAVLAARATASGPDPVAVPVLAVTTLTAFEAATGLPAAARHLLEGGAGLGRLAALLVAGSSAGTARPAPGALRGRAVTVELEGVGVRWSPERPRALDAVSLRLVPGRRVAVVGPSGSGKSTLLAVLSGAVDVEAGRYLLGGRDAATLHPDDVRSLVGGATQDAYVFHTSLRDNLALARPGATDAELTDALRRAHLAGWLAALPAGLDTVVGQDGATMSGGQRRRLVLARALLADPAVLLLDEPTEGLDPAASARLLAQTLEATRGRTTVLVTHTLDGLAALDEILVVDGGRVVQRGTHAELVAAPGPFGALRDATSAVPS